MRMRARTACCVTIARPAAQADGAGGQSEGYASPQGQTMAFVRPAAGDLTPRPAGTLACRRVEAFLPSAVDIRPGDGVWLQDAGALPAWRCVSVQKHSLHIAAILERRQPHVE